MARYNYTISGKKIEDTPENERLLRDRKQQHQGALSDYAQGRRNKSRAKGRVAKKSRRQNRGK